MQQGISQIQIHHADIAPLNRKAMLDLPELGFSDLHDSKDQAVTGRVRVVLADPSPAATFAEGRTRVRLEVCRLPQFHGNK